MKLIQHAPIQINVKVNKKKAHKRANKGKKALVLITVKTLSEDSNVEAHKIYTVS